MNLNPITPIQAMADRFFSERKEPWRKLVSQADKIVFDELEKQRGELESAREEARVARLDLNRSVDAQERMAGDLKRLQDQLGPMTRRLADAESTVARLKDAANSAVSRLQQALNG